ncbi:diguanylate cyclase, partial [Burkholderia vietnamiensis]|uniref:diguanylate cyclase n=1 Tax=Burkholderia vietnamiensis TaxID=60552 RepID=UPI001FC8A069
FAARRGFATQTAEIASALIYLAHRPDPVLVAFLSQHGWSVSLAASPAEFARRPAPRRAQAGIVALDELADDELAALDGALRFLAECIRKHVRRHGDIAARYGGEEFVAVLANTDENGAARVAEAIRQEIETNRLADFPEPVPAFTVSIGCATGRAGRPASVDALSHRADLA